MKQNLKKIMVDLFGIQEDEVTDGLSMDSTEAWDSLKHMELITSIEEEFEVSLTADEIVTMTNFAEIKRIIREQGVRI